jgi:hypothetical protein
MSEEEQGSTSGQRTVFTPYETRRILLAEGIQYHESDFDAKERWRQDSISGLERDPGYFRSDEGLARMVEHNQLDSDGRSDSEIAQRLLETLNAYGTIYSNLGFLENRLGDAFEVASDRISARYVNPVQQVAYELEIKHRKDEFKEALQTEGVIVVYAGHSRYGRGACFHVYDGVYPSDGDHWGDTQNDASGLFRMGYPWVPVALSDLEHHHYHFAPLPVEEEAPSRRRRHPFDRHPEARRRLRRIELPEPLRTYVQQEYRSPSNTYYGVTNRRGVYLLLHAGWEDTSSSPYSIGETEIRCRTFCHFGCSSRHHYWEIVRLPQYVGWERPDPPTDRFAYFSTAPGIVWKHWLYHLLTYNEPNGDGHWWASHEYAKEATIQDMRASGRRELRVY